MGRNKILVIIVSCFACISAISKADEKIATNDMAVNIGTVFAGAAECDIPLNDEQTKAMVKASASTEADFTNRVSLNALGMVELLKSSTPSAKNAMCAGIYALANELGVLQQ